MVCREITRTLRGLHSECRPRLRCRKPAHGCAASGTHVCRIPAIVSHTATRLTPLRGRCCARRGGAGWTITAAAAPTPRWSHNVMPVVRVEERRDAPRPGYGQPLPGPAARSGSMRRAPMPDDAPAPASARRSLSRHQPIASVTNFSARPNRAHTHNLALSSHRANPSLPCGQI